MDLQAKIAVALSDLDDLLRNGVSVEAALEVAAIENGVSIEALRSRASRTSTLEERRAKVLSELKLARQLAERKKAEAAGSLFVAAYEAEKRLGPLGQAEENDTAAMQADKPAQSANLSTPNVETKPPQQLGKRVQLKFDF